MIESNIKNELQTTPVDLLNQKLKVLHSPKHRVDFAIVANIVPGLRLAAHSNQTSESRPKDTYPMSHIGDS